MANYSILYIHKIYHISKKAIVKPYRDLLLNTVFHDKRQSSAAVKYHTYMYADEYKTMFKIVRKGRVIMECILNKKKLFKTGFATLFRFFPFLEKHLRINLLISSLH